MADISITATNVKANATALIDQGQVAGAAIAAGEIVYKEAASGKCKLADNDAVAAEIRSAYGMALNGAADGQPLNVAKNGSEINLGSAVLTVGTDYYLSGTPGKICPRADVTSGDDPVRIGWAKTTAILVLDIADMGVTL